MGMTRSRPYLTRHTLLEWAFFLQAARRDTLFALLKSLSGQITFRHTHVPTLAFLARMALANGITSILLAGWNTGSDVPPSWRSFVEREREANDPIITWLDN
jgi:hypothetical protein